MIEKLLNTFLINLFLDNPIVPGRRVLGSMIGFEVARNEFRKKSNQYLV